MIVYKATSLNLTQVGGPMGTERVTENWSYYFQDVEKAKICCEVDYKKSNRLVKIKWKIGYMDKLESQDLGYVQYRITPIKVK